MISYLNKFLTRLGLRKFSATSVSHPVRYKFNFPGFNNFHLLPYRNKKSVLSIFQSGWNMPIMIQKKANISIRS